MAVTVKVFSTPTCPWCVRAKEYLKSKKVKFEDKNVAEDEEARNEMVEKSGQMGVPVLVVEKDGEEKVIVGFDQAALDEALS